MELRFLWAFTVRGKAYNTVRLALKYRFGMPVLAPCALFLDLYLWLMGPAGRQLDTKGVSIALPPTRHDLGVIAGIRSLNPLFSALMLGQGDGTVSVAATAMPGMKDHITVPAIHEFFMNNSLALHHVLTFLRQGVFARDVNLADAVKALIQQQGGPDAM